MLQCMIKYQMRRWSINGVSDCESARWPARYSPVHNDMSQDAGGLQVKMTQGT